MVFLGPNPISWSSKKHTTVSRSSIEAEYRALATTAAKLYWLRQLFHDLLLFHQYLYLHLCLPHIVWLTLSATVHRVLCRSEIQRAYTGICWFGLQLLRVYYSICYTHDILVFLAMKYSFVEEPPVHT